MGSKPGTHKTRARTAAQAGANANKSGVATPTGVQATCAPRNQHTIPCVPFGVAWQAHCGMAPAVQWIAPKAAFGHRTRIPPPSSG